MTTEAVDIGVVSSRGQIAIPLDIRKMLGLEEGSKILFVVEDDTILMRKVTAASFSEITKPLREATKKIKENEVVNLIHNIRREQQR